MKNEIEQQIFEKMKAKDFGESMCNETKLNVLKWTMQQLRLHSVMSSADVNIVDSDIATIEVLHDLLLDAHGYSLDFGALKKARELTAKMYKALY